MNYHSIARRTAIFVLGHVFLLGAVLMFAGSVSNAGPGQLKPLIVEAEAR